MSLRAKQRCSERLRRFSPWPPTDTAATHHARSRQLLSCEIRIPIPFPCVALIVGEGRTPDRGFWVAFIPVKSHDDVPAVEDLPGVELANVTVEGTDFPAVQFRRTTVGPIEGPQAGLRIAKPGGKTLKKPTLQPGGGKKVKTKTPHE